MASELRDSRLERRRILNIIAFAFVALATVMGVFYINVFQDAASDLTRILSDRTAAWIAAPAPWPRLAQVVALPRWQDADALRRVLDGETLATPDGPLDIAGIPMPLLREVTRAMDGFEVAYLPANRGSGEEASVLVFVEIRDPVRRKRILGRLGDKTTVVDRHVGFRIDALTDNVWQRWAGVTPRPPRVVFMEPWIVFAWGAADKLEELLDARIEGRADAIRRRTGFIDSDDGGELHGALDVETAWRFIHRPDAPSQAPAIPENGFMRALGLVAFDNNVSADGDVLSLGAAITNARLAADLSQGLVSGPHELLALGPRNASIALSWRGSSLPASVRTIAVAAQRLSRDLPDVVSWRPASGDEAVGRRDPLPLLQRALVSAVIEEAGGAQTLGGPVEVAFFTTPGDGDAKHEWLVLIKSDSPERLEGELIATLSTHLEDDYALGEVMTPAGTLFIIADPLGEAVFVARLSDGLLELAPTAASLDRFTKARRGGETLAMSQDLVQAEALLPADRGVTLLLPNATLRQHGSPLVRVVAGQLSPSFPWLLTLEATPRALNVQSNIGPWTLVAALATAPSRDLDHLFLPGLDAACRARHEAMCKAYPHSPSCQPFELGRFPRIQRACDALAARDAAMDRGP